MTRGLQVTFLILRAPAKPHGGGNEDPVNRGERRPAGAAPQDGEFRAVPRQ
jgi:hypothetical protein